MNERIQELQRLAFDAVWNLDNDPIGPGTHFQPNGFEQKFAELIIQECTEVTADWYKNHNQYHMPPDEHIKAHFGVEE